MKAKTLAWLICIPMATSGMATASAQLKILDKIQRIADAVDSGDEADTSTPPSAVPAAPAFAAPASVSVQQGADFTPTVAQDSGLSYTFNVMLGEPPIAVARDTRCENVAPTNPAELVGNVLGMHKDQILDVLQLKRDDQNTDDEESTLVDSARLEMKRQVWLPLAIEEALGQRILEQRADLIIPEDDPAGADLYPPVRAVFDELKLGADGLQPYELEFLIYRDGEGRTNAEALPGGIVLVSENLAYESPERIFAYLSHELGHVTKRHQTMALQAKLIDATQGIDALSALTDLAGEDLLNRTLEVVDLTAAVFTRYYTAQELEADACGAKYLAGAPGNDGAKSIEMFLEDIGQSEKSAETPASGQDSSLVKEMHPSYDERRRILSENYAFWSTPH